MLHKLLLKIAATEDVEKGTNVSATTVDACDPGYGGRSKLVGAVAEIYIQYATGAVVPTVEYTKPYVLQTFHAPEVLPGIGHVILNPGNRCACE
jgi:hypothetical protein